MSGPKLYARVLEEQREAEQERATEESRAKAHRLAEQTAKTRHGRLAICGKCGSEWTKARLAVGCPTCAAIARNP